MVCGSSGDKGKSKKVDQNLGQTKKQLEKELRVLLLGAGESGKSTIFKQMKIIHLNGYTREECIGFKNIIYGNIVKAMKLLVQASLNLGIAIKNSENRVSTSKVFYFDNYKGKSTKN